MEVYLGQEPEDDRGDGGFFEGGGDYGDYEADGYHGVIIAGVVIYLTPCIPLSLRGVKGEGEDLIKKEGLTPLLDTPVRL
ncbi:hypothetical protein ES703_123401 [subsurface metagenome]